MSDRNNKTPLLVGGISAVAAAVVGGTYAVMQSPQTTEGPNTTATSTPTPEVETTPEASPTPTPEPTPEASPTPTPKPTPEATPEPTPEASPTPTPEPTPEASPTPTPAPEPTPEPIANPVEPVAIKPEVCQVTQGIISDANPPTNVRSSPEVKEGNVVATLDNGSFVSIQKRENGWFQIRHDGSEPIEGWISQNLTKTSCSQKVQRLQFPAGAVAIRIGDRFFGTGMHKYLLNANANQVMTIISQEGPLPRVFPPNDPNQQRELTGGAATQNKQRVQFELPATGDYTLEYSSNFRGYEYETIIQVK